MAINVFACEDGHAQERSLFAQVLKTAKAGELWIGESNMCTLGFLFGLHRTGSNFVIREHKSMPWEAIEPLKPVGCTETGNLFEQTVRLTLEKELLEVRRVVLELKKPTRNGENQIAIFTMLPTKIADSALVAKLYRVRWSVENLFFTLTENYECEIKTLGYPKAALFSFCLALVSYNILATVRAVMASIHGVGKIEAGL
ncbi:transposase [Nostoc sp.]|uniref:transposase n=1 Tax=Nostoc sp. TaxID=1180 RepID=UPI002FFA4260